MHLMTTESPTTANISTPRAMPTTTTKTIPDGKMLAHYKVGIDETVILLPGDGRENEESEESEESEDIGLPLPEPDNVTEATTRSPPAVTSRPDYVTGPALHLFALDKPLAGSMRGIRGADYECHRQAKRNRLKGTYRALLSSQTQSLNSLIYYSRDRQIPIVNARGQILFRSWEAMIDGTGAHFSSTVPIYSFDGKNVMLDERWPQKIIWHGSEKNGEFSNDLYCDRWHSKSKLLMGRASSLMKHMLLDQEEFSCNNSFIVLCIENTARRNFR